jgi:two-component system, cell cycle response regulator DivK
MARTILIIEDEPKSGKLLRDLLERFKYNTLEATDGELGIELAKTWKPDLILMDIMMPRMDGLEATRILKADPTTKHIPIIALTSYAMKGNREQVFKAKCDEYFAKPFDIHEVLKTVANFLSK